MTKEIPTKEVEIEQDDKGCPVCFNDDGTIVVVEGERIPKKLFFGKESPCEDTFHGKLQFLLYQAQWYKEEAEAHKASKDPKVKKVQKIEKLKAMILALESE